MKKTAKPTITIDDIKNIREVQQAFSSNYEEGLTREQLIAFAQDEKRLKNEAYFFILHKGLLKEFSAFSSIFRAK